MTVAHRTTTPRRVAREVALWVGAVIGVISITAAIAAFAFDVKPLVFRSGSMSPTIESGALALAREVPASDVEIGDVVSVIGSDGVRVTHRVVTAGETGGGVSLTLKGDANQAPDAEAYTVTRVDRVLWDVPYVGRIVAAAGSPVGVFACGALVMGCLYLAFAPRQMRSRRGRRSAGRHRSIDTRAVAAVLGGALLALPTVQPQGTLAYFTDTATMTVGSMSAAPLPVEPASMTCANDGFSAILTWPNAATASGLRYAHVVELSNNATNTGATTVVVPAASTATKSYTASSGLLGGLFSGTSLYVRVHSAYVAPGTTTVTWQSSSYRAWRMNLGIITGRVSCAASVQ